MQALPLQQRTKRNLRLIGGGIIVAVLLLDQALKFWVKTHMQLGQEIPLLGHWAILHFTENNGIAFGLAPSSELGKLALSLFRLIAVGLIIYVSERVLRRGQTTKGFYLGLTVIIAGALGNIIDGTFYGQLFSASDGLIMQGNELVQPIAQFLPEGGGYAPLFHGKVVDMLYFPIIQFYWPDWVPWLGGKHFLFFQPIFNLADTAITTGVLYLIIFQWRFITRHRS